MVFGARLAEIYDTFYAGCGKNWDVEVGELTGLVRDRFPTASSLLDVACGTGLHLGSFRRTFEKVVGVELAEPMLAIARRRLPGVPLHHGDMRDFSLDARFDAVCCLFASISYVSSIDELRGAIATMTAHLVEGGVLVVEPWIFPEDFVDGAVSGRLVRADGRTIARICRFSRDGRFSLMDASYLVGDSGGVHTVSEKHRMALFSAGEYRAAFEAAGCATEYLPGGPSGYGLFVGVRR